jgi:SAM-dependent methyltransferase
MSVVRDYRIGDHAVRLRHHPLVFSPSAFGLQFAAQLHFGEGERVADIGTGTGIHAILAAKMGAGEVVATDPCRTAVDLAEYNAVKLNNVPQVRATQGCFFATATGTFDAIVANLPQEILPPAYLARLPDDVVTGINGQGPGGNKLLLQLLGLAPPFMHRHTRLYIIVNTVTDYRQTLARVGRDFSTTVLWEGTVPTKEFVGAHIGWYRALIDRGVIDVFPGANGEWSAREYVLELRRR